MADGTALTLHVATTGTALAEASLFADTYHCDAIARTDAQVANVSRVAFRAARKTLPDAALSLIETNAKRDPSTAREDRDFAPTPRFRKAGCLAGTLWKAAQRRMGPRGR